MHGQTSLVYLLVKCFVELFVANFKFCCRKIVYSPPLPNSQKLSPSPQFPDTPPLASAFSPHSVSLPVEMSLLQTLILPLHLPRDPTGGGGIILEDALGNFLCRLLCTNISWHKQGVGTQPHSLLSPPGPGSVRLCNAMETKLPHSPSLPHPAS
jgi:hypothetical protein